MLTKLTEYFRIRIPEPDQHVHRFLWRNLEIDREPDVYVMTVLTFGDKPAPAIAQMALRKTADEAKDEFPVAAQVLKDNTYMDDICDSVLTEEEALELTKCIDSVLETGGFKVKGWLSNKAKNSDAEQQNTREAEIPQNTSDEKVLGVAWNDHTDTLTFKVKPALLHTQEPRQLSMRVLPREAECQVMADLPGYRLAPFTPPFYYTSCDYSGPYHVKVGRNRTMKHYGVIFTCLNTRAVHLELAVDYSTMEFIQVLRRFFAVRGQPRLMIGDNGSQFVGAERELKEMIRRWDTEQLREFSAEQGVEWKFITPESPHQNGCAEALVKSCKLALKKAIGDQVLTPFGSKYHEKNGDEETTCLVTMNFLVQY